MISWKVMFFKREKSRMEDFYLCFNNVLVRKLLAPISLGTPYLYKGKKRSNFPECGLLSQVWTEV